MAYCFMELSLLVQSIKFDNTGSVTKKILAERRGHREHRRARAAGREHGGGPARPARLWATSTDKIKLDGVGPVDNRPSIDILHHFVRKKINNNNTCDT